MRLVEFEEKLTPIEYIKRDCQPFLQQADDPLMLYRGMRFSDNQHFIRKKARLDNRQPQAMSDLSHKIINEYFVDEFGFPFRNGVFTVPNKNLASSFGITHNVFPIGEFRYLWSPKVEDLNYKLEDEEIGSTFDPEEYEEELVQTLESYKYRDFGLNDAADFGHEIMIWCLHYYAMPSSHIDHMLPQYFKKELYNET